MDKNVLIKKTYTTSNLERKEHLLFGFSVQSLLFLLVTITCKSEIKYFKIGGKYFSVWSFFNNNFLFTVVG